MQYRCNFYKENVSEHNKITPFCSLLTATIDNQPQCAVGHCSFKKTYAQYNHKKVEAQIAEYGRTHE